MVTYNGDGDQYVVSDWFNTQVVIIDNKGQVVETRYKGDMKGVKLKVPHGIITDPHSGVLIANCYYHQVLLLRRTDDVTKILDQHVRSPRILYLDIDHHRLYVSGTDQHDTQYVFVFNYTQVAMNSL